MLLQMKLKIDWVRFSSIYNTRINQSAQNAFQADHSDISTGDWIARCFDPEKWHDEYQRYRNTARIKFFNSLHLTEQLEYIDANDS